ncbi:MAG: serine/threonine protein kinase [Planctomycetota bacterium]|nr:MAG: serine/threonine protein kinase [Planctomycetota bacterium]
MMNPDISATPIQDSASQARSARRSRQSDEPPGSVPGYHLLGLLGEGSFGSVWLARELTTGIQVAIKFYTRRGDLDWALLAREVEKLARLDASRHIVRLDAVGWSHEPPYYVMEYVENGALADRLRDGPLPAADALRIARGILRGLADAHAAGILHCDLKPANVLLDAAGEPRLCDFGQARRADESTPALGTLFYMAPEQALPDAVPDARWDVYALGALLYHMLVGHPPYRNDQNQRALSACSTVAERLQTYREIVLHSPPPSEHRRVAGVDRGLADIIDRCLERTPERRLPNAQSVLRLLELRDRRRAARPLLVFGGLAPLIVLLSVFVLASQALQNLIRKAEANLTERALESDVVSAKILARSIERELQDRTRELLEIARNDDLRRLVMAAEGSRWRRREELQQWLDRVKRAIDTYRRCEQRALDTSWFLVDRNGFQRWRNPFDPDTIDHCYAFRDYFHGRGVEYPQDGIPPGVGPIRRPHVSLAFQSQATEQFMVAVSVPIWSPDGHEVIGILARTTHLDRLLTEYKDSISGQGDPHIARTIALADARNGRLLAHPVIDARFRRGDSLDPRLFQLPADITRRFRDLVRKADDGLLQPCASAAPSAAGGATPAEHRQSSADQESPAASRHAEPSDRAPPGTASPSPEKRRPGPSGAEAVSAAQPADGDSSSGSPSDVADRTDAYRDPAYSDHGIENRWLAAFAPIGRTGWVAIVQERHDAALRPVSDMRQWLSQYALLALVVCGGLIGGLWFLVLRAVRTHYGEPAAATVGATPSADRPVD